MVPPVAQLPARLGDLGVMAEYRPATQDHQDLVTREV